MHSVIWTQILTERRVSVAIGIHSTADNLQEVLGALVLQFELSCVASVCVCSRVPWHAYFSNWLNVAVRLDTFWLFWGGDLKVGKKTTKISFFLDCQLLLIDHFLTSLVLGASANGSEQRFKSKRQRMFTYARLRNHQLLLNYIVFFYSSNHLIKIYRKYRVISLHSK